MRVQRNGHFGAGGDDDGAGAFGIAQHVAAARDSVHGGGITGHERQVLARQQQRGRAAVVHVHADAGGARHGGVPGHGGFSRIARAPQRQVGNQAQAGSVFDGLVGRAVFAQADRIVREHVHHALLHQRGHADGVARVIRERQERAAEGQVAAVQRHAVHDGGHAEFAHAVVDVTAELNALVAGANGAHALPVGEVGTGQIGGTAQHFGQQRRQRGDCELRGLAGGDGFGLFQRRGQESLELVGVTLRHFALHAAREFSGFGGERGAVGVKRGLPFGLGRGARLAAIPAVIHVLRNLERFRRPAQRGARGGDFVLAQRRAVHVVRAGHVGRTLADDGAADHQRGLFRLRTRGLDGGVHGGDVVAVNAPDHVPAVAFEALGGVVGKPVFNVAVDRDAVIVIQHDQLGQLERAGQRAHLVRDAFHQAAVAGEGVGVVVDDGVAGLVEFSGQQRFGQRHAHGIAQALAQRAGGRFHARGDAHFGVTRRLGMQLAEILELVDRQVVTRQMQQRVDQHRAVAVGQHKAVAVGPGGILRVVAQVARP